MLTVSMMFSCNDTGEKVPAAPSSMDQEKQLIQQINNHPDSFQLTDQLAGIYQASGAYDQAIAVMKKRALRDSMNDKLQEAIGFLYYEKDDTLQAIKHYKNAYRLVPDKSYIIAMATLEAGLANPIALQLADEIMKIDEAGSADEAHYIKGIFYQRINNNDLAIQNFDQAIKISYTFTPPYLEKAQLLMGKKSFAAALATLDLAIAVQNNFPEAYYYKAICLYEMGDRQKALEAFDMALMYDPEYEDALNDKKKYFSK